MIFQGHEHTIGRPANISQDSAFRIPGGMVKPFVTVNLISLKEKCTDPSRTGDPLLVAQSTLNYDKRLSKIYPESRDS
jgi:hypothetical protein